MLAFVVADSAVSHRRRFVNLDMELQVLVHGVDVVEDVVGDAWDDTHQLGVVELSLGKNQPNDTGRYPMTNQNYYLSDCH